MSEIDWTDVKAVRDWLEVRYPATPREHGSPFFQYLKDELAKGNKIRGRERHLSGNELLRWIGETQEDRAFYYPAGSMKTVYYPEYNSKANRGHDRDPNEQALPTLPNESARNQSPPQQSEHPEASTPHKRKAAHKSNGAKSDSLHNKSAAKSRRAKIPSRTSKSTGVSRPKGLRSLDSEGSRDPTPWTSRLRSPGSQKRSKTGKNFAQ